MRNEELVLSLTGSEYIRYLFENTKDGKLTMEYKEYTYPMAWDRQAAENLVACFEELRRNLEQIAQQRGLIGDHPEETNILTEAQQKVWDTYLAPFPDHGMDAAVLFDIGTKDEAGEALTESEKRMQRLHLQWLEENALKRLPYKACAPTDLIHQVRRYEKLVSLRAPKIILENEARRLAERMVLYHCAKPFHHCRCCDNVYELDSAGVTYSVCPVCLWEEDHTPANEYSDTNGASLLDYRKHFYSKNHT